MTTPRDPDRTRRSILDAAATEFCAAGLAGARIDSIAAAAGVNKRMLYHYFGNKDGLFAAVLAERLGAPSKAPAPTRLEERLTAAQRRAAQHPEQTRLLMWEALAHAGQDVPEVPARTAAWRDPVAANAAAQRAGRLRGDVDAAQLELALTALVLFPFAFPQLTQLITGTTPDEAAFLAAHSAFLTTVGKLFEMTEVNAAPEPAKPRYRLAATVTESAARSGGE
ncbi:MAG: TetR/AcrR family transcriptional regulator [Proteobacteria bacterium]|nr:TetR/AcrR family transcriptional regulator [Pseudomonadota bacterium]